MSKREPYFEQLDAGLKKAGIFHPVLVIDLDRLDQNIETLLSHLPSGMGYRIVAKSLPVPKLLAHIRKKTGTDRLMTFNLPMLLDLSREAPDAHQLLGKPLPAAALREFLSQTDETQTDRVCWLIDTKARLESYQNIALEFGSVLNIALELDVGLHRGGFEIGDELEATLNILQQSNSLRFAGFMGYEPHLASIPKTLGWRKRATKGAWSTYQKALDLAKDVFGEAQLGDIIRNTAGSPTFRLYTDTSIGNEVSVGSALVKPTDFDTELLEPYAPACFIAAPVLKAVGATRMPAFEFADGIKRTWSANSAQTFFIHGGKWMATPVDPPNLSFNKLFGRSSNQEMLNGPMSLDLEPDDFVFFRPHQSEAVFLQFGDVVVMRGGEISDRWATFQVSA